MTFGTLFARNNIVEEYSNKDPFWTPYTGEPQFALLNNVQVPSDAAIRQYQIEKIRVFTRDALNDKFNNMDDIANQSFANLLKFFESNEKTVVDTMLENFVTKKNSFYYHNNKTEERSDKEWKTLQTKLQNLEKALQQLMTELKIPKEEFNQPTVMGKTLQTVQNAMTAANLSSLNPGEINDFLKHINQMKGDTLEELGVAYLKSLKLPNINSIRLGSVYLKTSQKNRHSGQLIQDLIAYNMDAPELMEQMVEYKTIDGVQKTATLKQFFADVEAANGQSKQIIIEDSTYNVLMNLDQISIQAKSGKNQLPWNQNKSTKVKINEFSEDDGLLLSVHRTFSLLHSLNSMETDTQPWMVKDTSADYQALANYGLATVLYKVLHLSTQGNQYLLTPYGFMTFADRMEQLLKEENYIALIQGQISLSENNVMETPRAVGITK